MTNYIKTQNGYARTCGKCGGDGIYWLSIMTASGPSAKKDVCFPCRGTGVNQTKTFSSIEEIELADARNEKARERKEAKRQAEWEAGREERELEEARREQARLEREAEDASWVYLDGQIGDKVTVIGNVANATTIEGQYGQTRLIVIETIDKQAVKMFTTAEWCWSVQTDDAISVTGTIKSFDEYRGRRQTVLVRPKKAW